MRPALIANQQAVALRIVARAIRLGLYPDKVEFGMGVDLGGRSVSNLISLLLQNMSTQKKNNNKRRWSIEKTPYHNNTQPRDGS